ncbi:MAG: hypothetical protein C0404_11080 [Verrucomicrobia bacterium]|nr:hypothetical protein [Verrucomicrobiota bacterium]
MQAAAASIHTVHFSSAGILSVEESRNAMMCEEYGRSENTVRMVKASRLIVDHRFSCVFCAFLRQFFSGAG